ncbi:hypothetical protein PVAP13_5KG395607 [Panicum virgatum]|uniref:Uncharacterized protein n=1 Tax=Panicum virgatum TaxID=38727 RepID=A0A8T0SJX6_PANVG|nr:hypothetical protein PVAP13_5KG395607 [Panicum virgatum]
MSMSKEEMIGVLCDYISTIHDAGALEQVWVRSFQPYNISVKVKDMKVSLRVNQQMFVQCFNFGVRVRAYSEYIRLRYSRFDISKHYMDLRFCDLCELDHHPNYRKKPSGGKELAGVIGRWSIMGYDPLRCKFVRSLLYICFLWRIVWVSQYLLIL